MRQLPALVAATTLCLATAIAVPAHAASPIPITFGSSWDPPSQSLQTILDTYLGVPGALDVHADFIGAKPGELDPWFWVGSSFPALLVSEVAGNANTNQLGWYVETLTMPAIDGINDGVVFSGAESGGANAIVVLPSGTTKFGFYLDPAPWNPGAHQRFFTNRFHNDVGPNGAGAVHAPFDGDVQAIVFDVSRWKGPDTWLVCFEDIDSGRAITPCCAGTDNDFNDLVFEVTALGATPARALTFGALKARYGAR